jgi:hypothetical protein
LLIYDAWSYRCSKVVWVDGLRLYELAHGIDESLIVSDRPTQSISAEDTFERDVPLIETEPMIRRLAELTWVASRKESRVARTGRVEIENCGIQDPHRQSHAAVSAFLLRRADSHCPLFARASRWNRDSGSASSESALVISSSHRTSPPNPDCLSEGGDMSLYGMTLDCVCHSMECR